MSLRETAARGSNGQKVAAGNRSAPGLQWMIWDLRPSCTLRFENYRFYNASMVQEVPQEPLPPDTNNGRAQIFIIIFVPVVVLIIVLVVLGVFWRKRKYKNIKKKLGHVESFNEDESLQYDFDTITTATNNFSDDNKLGKGGFGAVYMDKAFRLLGFCTQKTEKLLVYEFVQKGSLDHYIFGNIFYVFKQQPLLIKGIAKELVCLHEDSRLRIIHRDLKASNVLLDEEINPKIADFGMARLFAQDETQGNTSRVVGTYGYMAPEYAIQGQFSMKTDVFSFGVLVLEIITGQKSLLCVQENANNRPTMASVVLMLNSSSVTMPIPSRLAFYMVSYDQEYSAVTQDRSFSASNTTASVNDVSITEFDGR
ncbi:hypothetical protein RD792_007733 [Penstemon davidsonii]|uniref:Protein kinase domain-containing protein n=1 Tax=Penstemon davidsonii TaxID=160366 RepID=A0ABR0D782_9LAMI|nr:hypothetical protein RD792_007733 [Penstemon davidsonii]